FFFQSLPATPYPGVDMPEHVKMTTDATFLAIKTKSGLCAGHSEEVVYPITVLSPHTETSSNPDMYSFQNADPQCGRSNASRQFYISYSGVYVRKDTAETWWGAMPAPTYPYKDDPHKRGPPAFVLVQDSSHYMCFGFLKYADSTDLNHIFYPFYPLIYLQDTERGREEARSTSELRYNYAVVKIEAPDRLTYTLNIGDLIGTWNQKDTLVPTGVNEQSPARSQESMKIYPNPAAHEATVKLSQAPVENRTFYVFDALGRIVSEFGINAGEDQHRLNLEAFPAGIYFITGKRNGEKTAMMVVE
ncbi:MAG: T9SS type A sorting domain-containing protein, partial [Candidatus Micrarchaeota archaeon]